MIVVRGAFLGAALAMLSWGYVDTIFAIRGQYTMETSQVDFRFLRTTSPVQKHVMIDDHCQWDKNDGCRVYQATESYTGGGV